MASLSAPADNKRLKSSNEQLSTIQFRLTDSEVFYQGGYYALSTSGRLTEPSDTAGVRMLGLLSHFGEGAADASGKIPTSVTGDTSASPEPEAVIDIGAKIVYDVPVAGASAVTDIGKLVYLSSDNWEADLTLTETTNIPAVGLIVDQHSSTEFDVLLFSAAEMARSQGKTTKALIGTIHTTMLEGTSSANLIDWEAPHAGIVSSVSAHATGFDSGYSSGIQGLTLYTDAGSISGGTLSLSAGQIDAIGDMATEIAGGTVTNATGNAEFSAGGSVLVSLDSGGTGYTAAVDTVSYNIFIEYLELPAL